MIESISHCFHCSHIISYSLSLSLTSLYHSYFQAMHSRPIFPTTEKMKTNLCGTNVKSRSTFEKQNVKREEKELLAINFYGVICG